MTFYLLYDAGDRKPYSLVTSNGLFSAWQPSMETLLSIPLYAYVSIDVDIACYVTKPDYPIIATFDYQPTAETNPELFI